MWLKAVELVVTLALVILTAPLAAEVQQAGKVPRIGYLAAGSAELDKGWLAAFQQGLRELGYLEGKNIVIERRHAAGQLERLPELAAELVRLPVDLIVAPGGATAVAAKQATITIPIVFVTVADPVGSGLVASLNTLLGEKRLELLKQDAPHMSRVRVCTIRRLQASSRQCTPSWRPPVRWP